MTAEEIAERHPNRSVLCVDRCNLWQDMGDVCGGLCQQKRWEVIDATRK